MKSNEIFNSFLDAYFIFPATHRVWAAGDPNQKTTTLTDGKTLTVDGEKCTLYPIQTDSGDLTGYSYDHYKDEVGNIYKFYAGTDLFAEYQRNIDHVALGNTEVKSSVALLACEDFLKRMGYDVTGFELEHSNDYSYDFKATYSFSYQGFFTNEKLVFHVMANQKGNVYVTSFRATDYGRFSQDEQLQKQTLDLDALKVQLKISCR